jgi:protein involved in polysaccharide export with SLBB domain
VIELTVWREEDLTGEFIIDEAGIVTLPLLGDRKAVGIPVQQLREELIREYRVELQNPSITITPLRRVYVLGEVNKPGLYNVDPTVSLGGAVALAGGATGTGDLNQIHVVRNGRQVLARVSAETALQSGDIRSGDQIFVGQRSWLVRNSTFVVSMLFSATTIAISILRR